MDVTDISKHLDKLDDNVDGLEAALKPILTDLDETASKLPLLDRAKLYITVAYSIESTLHSALRLGGVDTKTHSITKELTRLKQYFGKLKQAEEPPADRTHTVDKQAAIRFIKADLADNSEINAKLKEKLAIEREKAAAIAAAKGKKRPAEDANLSIPSGADNASNAAVGSSAEEGQINEPASKKPKKARSRKGRGDRSKKNKTQQ